MHMTKKILFLLVAVVVVIGGVAAMSAYEAHIINVTAKIENSLDVSTKHIEFGTVFPQEKLSNNELTISLSQSFLAEDRVDDVNYVIKEKPKVKKVTKKPVKKKTEAKTKSKTEEIDKTKKVTKSTNKTGSKKSAKKATK